MEYPGARPIPVAALSRANPSVRTDPGGSRSVRVKLVISAGRPRDRLPGRRQPSVGLLQPLQTGMCCRPGRRGPEGRGWQLPAARGAGRNTGEPGPAAAIGRACAWDCSFLAVGDLSRWLPTQPVLRCPAGPAVQHSRSRSCRDGPFLSARSHTRVPGGVWRARRPRPSGPVSFPAVPGPGWVRGPDGVGAREGASPGRRPTPAPGPAAHTSPRRRARSAAATDHVPGVPQRPVPGQVSKRQFCARRNPDPHPIGHHGRSFRASSFAAKHGRAATRQGSVFRVRDSMGPLNQ